MESNSTLNSGDVEKTLPNPAATAAAAEAVKSGSPWVNVLVGGVPGILLGAGGYEFLSKHVDVGGGETTEEPVEVQPVAEEEVSTLASESESESASASTSTAASAADSVASFEVHEAHSVSDDMSFGEAFAHARAEVGMHGAFVWHGQVYSTFRGDDPEWAEMSAEERIAHSDHILSQVHPRPYTPTVDEPEIVEVHSGAEVQDVSGQGVESEVDVHIVGMGTVDLGGESEVAAAYGEVDGIDAVFADTDGDGEVDVVFLDVDGDGMGSLDEMLDASATGYTMEGLGAQAEYNSAEMLDDHLYAGMPDYTDGADMGNLV